MTGVDPDDERQVAVVMDALSFWTSPTYTLSTVLLRRLRDHLAAQPRVIELPAEDRTRKWVDPRGAVWMPRGVAGDLYWQVEGSQQSSAAPWWDRLLGNYGPLTDAGPADGAR